MMFQGNEHMSIEKDHFVFTIILIFSVNSIVAEQVDSVNLEKLSPEVIAVMEGNQKNIDSIHTLQAVIKMDNTYDYGDEGSFKLVETQKIIYDCNHLRVDQLEKKFTGDKKYENYGDQEGTIDIDSKESNIDYVPSNNNVFIRPPEWSNSYKLRNNPLLKYQSARGATLKENVLASVKNDFYFSAKSETVDGEDCVLLTCDYKKPDSTLKIWVVPSKGYCIKKVEDSTNGSISEEYSTTLKKYPNEFWWFDTAHVKTTSVNVNTDTFLLITSLKLNEQIDPEMFSVWGMGLSSTTKIYDEIQGTNYTLAVDDIDTKKKNYAPQLIIIATLVFIVLGMLIKGRVLLRK